MDGMSTRSLRRPGRPQASVRAALAVMCLGVLVAQLDSSVVNLAIERIGRTLHAPVGALQWVLDAYNLVYAVLLLTGGALADIYGRRRIFRIGAAVLAIASAGCAVAPTIGLLIVARAVAGLGAALMVPTSLAIIRVVFADAFSRGRALGVWASCNGLAFVIGPTIGGVLIGGLGWRSVFILVLPMAVAAFVLAGIAVPESFARTGRRLDLLGQIFGAMALALFVFSAIAAGQVLAIWVATLAGAIVAFALFILVERRGGQSALVPLGLFSGSAFRAAMAATAAMTFGVYGMVFLLPLVWQASGFLDPGLAGIALVPCALMFFLVSQASGWLTERFGVQLMIAGGTCLIGLGLLMLGLTVGGRPMLLAETGLVVAGIGLGLNTGPLMSVAVGAVSAARAGTASALINVARMVGATLGIAILGALYAAVGGSAAGLSLAMLAGRVQVLTAVLVWRALPPRHLAVARTTSAQDPVRESARRRDR